MNITELNKVATRKRICTDVEKLRNKISQENKKVIKLKVAQDTAYWDLREKLSQVEKNHEKLQQNMLEVQMQYETVSGQYQDELRHRAETLNNFTTTQEICTVLEDHCERLRDTLARCKADQTALYEAYQQSGQVLREMKTQQVQQTEMSRRTIEDLQEKLKLTTDHHNQLKKCFDEERQRFSADLEEAKRTLNSVLGKNNELLAANTELGALVDHSRRDLEKKEETIQNLQRDIKKLIQEFNSQASELTNTMHKQEIELQESNASNDALKQALHNKENFTKSVCDQRNQLQEKLALIEEEHANTGKIVKDLEIQLLDINRAKEHLQYELTIQAEKYKNLEQEITTKNEVVATLENEVLKLENQISASDLEKAELMTALEKSREENQALNTRVQELTESGIELEKKMQILEDSKKKFEKKEETSEAKLKELNNLTEQKDKDLSAKTSTISHLMNEIKNISDVRANLETSIKKVRQELLEEKDSAGEREKRLSMKNEQLEINIKKKDMELSSNLSVILELRNDKERLNEKIENMQKAIDNVQKELTRPAFQQPKRVEPEQDDNAVMMLTPASKQTQQPKRKGTELGPLPSREEQNDSLLFNFNFMSDHSLDADKSIDKDYVNRRFEMLSRGEYLPPANKSSLKRPVATPQNSRRNKQSTKSAKDEDMVPLSEIKTSEQSKPRSFFKTTRQDRTKQKFY